MYMLPDEETEVIEPEQWKNPEEQQFNHQVLVMMGIKKCLELGSKELREGWWEEKVDRIGNVRKTYHEDTRRAFIESVKSLLMVIECDFDDDARTSIRELQRRLVERKKFWMGEEWRWWNTLSPMQQQQMTKEGKQVIRDFFNPRLNFDNFYFDEETDIYRSICTEINNLTKRLDFYGGTDSMA